MNSSGLVWHYTKYDVVEKIITNHELWAADFSGLNDATELKLGDKRVSRAFKKLRRGWDWYDDTAQDVDFDELKRALDLAASDLFHGSAFVSCFSPESDDTQQWQKYARADGFAVAIPFGVHLPVLGEYATSRIDLPYIEESPFRWLRMLYEKREQLDAATRGIWEIHHGVNEGAYIDARHDLGDNFGSIFRNRGTSGYVDAVASIKHKDFLHEREIRYAVTRPENPAAIRPTPGGSSTHVRITGAADDPFAVDRDLHDSHYYQAKASNLPIVKIRVGPGNDFKTEQARLRPLLDANGYSAVGLVKSKSPFR